jgi:hypothetical protein
MSEVSRMATAENMPEFAHFSNKGRRRIAALQRRAAHLEARIATTNVLDLSWDKQELAALKWALGLLSNMRLVREAA